MNKNIENFSLQFGSTIMKKRLKIIFVLIAVLICSIVLTAQVMASDITKEGETIVTADAFSTFPGGGGINGSSFQQDAIISYNGWQYAAYYNNDRHVSLTRRMLPDGEWESPIVFTDYTQSTDDGHATISIGISPGDGTIHLAFDTFVNLLKYRKSDPGLATNPGNYSWVSSRFGTVQNKLEDWNIDKMTYPRFVMTPENKLLFDYRTAPSGYHRQRFMHEYDPSTGSWTFLGKYMDNEDNSASAYINGLMFDNSGRLHMTWVWRDGTDASSNHDLNYAYSDDNGRKWKNNAGAEIATTGSSYIKESTTGVKVRTIGINRGLTNQEGQYVDNDGRIHVLLSHMDPSEPDEPDFGLARKKSYYYHYWREIDGNWNVRKIPRLASSRGKIVFDAANNAYAIIRNLELASASSASGWTDWAVINTTDANKYFFEPAVDTYRLKYGDGKLSVFQMEKPFTQIEEAESLATSISTGALEEDVARVDASNGYYNSLSQSGVGDFVEYTVDVQQTGTYNVKLHLIKGTDKAQFQLSIDGVDQGPVIDGFNTNKIVSVDVGRKAFSTTGNKTFRLTVTGKNAWSTGYLIDTDFIRLQNVEPVKYMTLDYTLASTSAQVGAVILDEDFNDGTANNWSAIAGAWSVSSGKYQQTATTGRNVAYYANGASWADYTYSADVVRDSGGVGITFRGNSNMSNYYVFRIQSSTNLEFGKVTNGVWSSLKSYAYPTTIGKTYNMKVILNGSSIALKLNGTLVAEETDTSFSNGTAGLYAFNTSTTFDNTLVIKKPLLDENFNDGLAQDWSVLSGTWNLSYGKFRQTETTSGRKIAYYANGSSWTDYTYSADAVSNSGSVGIVFRGNSNLSNYYVFRIQSSTNLEFGKVTNGVWSSLKSYSYPTTIGKTYNMKVILNGSSISLKMNDTLMATETDTSFSSGTAGLYSFSGSASFDNAAVIN